MHEVSGHDAGFVAPVVDQLLTKQVPSGPSDRQGSGP